MITGQLGVFDSQLGNIVLAGETVVPATAGIITSQLGTYDSQLGLLFLGGSGISLLTGTATNTLTLTGTATAYKVITASVVSSMPLTHVAGPASNIVISNLTFSQTVRGFRNLNNIRQTLTVSQVVALSRVTNRATQNLLSLNQFVSATNSKIVNSTINFVGTATGQTTKIAKNTLNLTHTAFAQYGQHSDFATTVLNFTSLVIRQLIRNRNITHSLSISQQIDAKKVKNIFVSNTLPLTNNVSIGKLLSGSNTLALSHTVNVQTIRNRSVSNQLSLTQTLNRQMIYNRAVASQVQFKTQYLTGLDYLADTAIGVLVQNYIVLEGLGSVITLPAPLLGDTQNNQTEVKVHRTMTGLMYTYVKDSKTQRLRYEFEVDYGKAEEFRLFMIDELTNKIIMTNWKGEIWSVFILNNPNELIASSYGGACGETYRITLELEGLRVS